MRRHEEVIRFRLGGERKAVYAEAAKVAGLTVSDWLRRLADRATEGYPDSVAAAFHEDAGAATMVSIGLGSVIVLRIKRRLPAHEWDALVARLREQMRQVIPNIPCIVLSDDVQMTVATPAPSDTATRTEA